MKRKYFLLLTICCSLTTFTIAQGFKFGIKGGADIHKVSGKSFSEQFTFGYHLGGYVNIGLTSKFGIQPELIFSKVNVDTGTNFKAIYPQFNTISKIRLSYLSIPVLLSFKPNKFVALQAGPQYSILMDQSSSLLTNGSDAFKNGDFSVVGGLQLNISKLNLYGRYVVGLNNINDIDNRDKWKNQSVQIGIGIGL
jgi:hypothetical protein